MKELPPADALQSYATARSKLRSMRDQALSAADAAEKQGELQDNEVGDLCDAKSELRAGIEQIIGNLDILATANPLEAYNLAVGFIFALRGYARFGGFFSVYETPAKRFADHLKAEKMRPSRKASLSEEEREVRLAALRIARAAPLGYPLGKRTGPSALAPRLLDAFNSHLKQMNLPPVNVGVIEKLLRENPYC